MEYARNVKQGRESVKEFNDILIIINTHKHTHTSHEMLWNDLYFNSEFNQQLYLCLMEMNHGDGLRSTNASFSIEIVDKVNDIFDVELMVESYFPWSRVVHIYN